MRTNAKNKSTGLTIFGWYQILIGAVGSIPTIGAFGVYLRILYRRLTNGSEPFSGAPVPGLGDSFTLALYQQASMCTFALVFLLISGILTLRLSPFARRINIYLLPFLLILQAVYAIASASEWKLFDNNTDFFLTYGIVGLLLGVALFQRWFFTRPQVKARFEYKCEKSKKRRCER